MTIDLHSALEDCKELLKSIREMPATEYTYEAVRLLSLHFSLLDEDITLFTEETHDNVLWTIYTLAMGYDEGEGEGEAPL